MPVNDQHLIEISDDVAAALDRGEPVVALESTLITHGLPWPVNRDTALDMEREVREAGAIPATIAVLDGAIRVGLSGEEIERLSGADGQLKISSRGLAYAVATGRTAGTTVSGTMWVASRAGIPFFGTGGIGGVHIGAEKTGDVSNDLSELARTPVAVICSGVKSILDIGRTLEYLETVGVPVFGYRTDEFPAFFSGRSGHPAPYRLEGPDQVASVWQVHRTLGQKTGIVIACPPPVAVEDQDQMQRAIDQANREAADNGIHGGEVTPFVLRRIAEITDGASVQVNTALLRHNARIAAEIAVAYREVDA